MCRIEVDFDPDHIAVLQRITRRGNSLESTIFFKNSQQVRATSRILSKSLPHIDHIAIVGKLYPVRFAHAWLSNMSQRAKDR
jgi:hypothetical protein